LLKKYIFLCFQNPYFSKQLNDIIILLPKFYIHKTKITQKNPHLLPFIILISQFTLTETL